VISYLEIAEGDYVSVAIITAPAFLKIPHRLFHSGHVVTRGAPNINLLMLFSI
jgi:hypothetical protein